MPSARGSVDINKSNDSLDGSLQIYYNGKQFFNHKLALYSIINL